MKTRLLFLALLLVIGCKKTVITQINEAQEAMRKNNEKAAKANLKVQMDAMEKVARENPLPGLQPLTPRQHQKDNKDSSPDELNPEQLSNEQK